MIDKQSQLALSRWIKGPHEIANRVSTGGINQRLHYQQKLAESHWNMHAILTVAPLDAPEVIPKGSRIYLDAGTGINRNSFFE